MYFTQHNNHGIIRNHTEGTNVPWTTHPLGPVLFIVFCLAHLIPIVKLLTYFHILFQVSNEIRSPHIPNTGHRNVVTEIMSMLNWSLLPRHDAD